MEDTNRAVRVHLLCPSTVKLPKSTPHTKCYWEAWSQAANRQDNSGVIQGEGGDLPLGNHSAIPVLHSLCRGHRGSGVNTLPQLPGELLSPHFCSLGFWNRQWQDIGMSCAGWSPRLLSGLAGGGDGPREVVPWLLPGFDPGGHSPGLPQPLRSQAGLFSKIN